MLKFSTTTRYANHAFPKGQRLILLMTALLLCACVPPKRQHLQTKSAPEEKNEVVQRPNSILLRYTGFTVSYNPENRLPDWVSYTLTAEQVEATKHTPKMPRRFMPDPNLNLPQASSEDYRNSGWVKGHMARRQDMKWSEQAAMECDYFTNICPQNTEMNNGIWHKIENMARRVAVKYDSVLIVCGPIFDSPTPETIGPNRVRIPDSFFKAFLIKRQNAYHSIAFICPNSSDSVTVTGTMQNVNSVESLTGLDLFDFLDDSVEEKVEQEADINFWK